MRRETTGTAFPVPPHARAGPGYPGAPLRRRPGIGSSVGLASAHASLVTATIKPGHGQAFAHNAYPRTRTTVFAENVTAQASFVAARLRGRPGRRSWPRRSKGVCFPVRNLKEITVGLPANLNGCGEVGTRHDRH